ncbi:nitrilase-related carbon-nitrogen hydrolase [Gottschalkia acidurici]|uniref:nitrilase-related carbon-nitrogen hydrolase n=1 Tax=Clostridium acidurici TaxID=1556 RepID=UPI0002F58EF7|nr:nitrilase-related carbon-nitrogen hydrolase [Gottschalkia acidurici]
MVGINKSVRVTVIQAAPIIMNPATILEKILILINKAKEMSINIVVFPESFIPSYLRGLSFGSVVGSRIMEGFKNWQCYYENSVTVPNNVTDILGKYV